MEEANQQVQHPMEQVPEEELLRLVQAEAMQLPDLNIAVSGLAGRFPKSDSVNEFEQNLYEGKDMINDQDNSRFTCGLWNLPPRAGRLKDLSRFDSEFFGYTAEEANYVDFQLRILYEVVYESILDAGVNPAELRGTKTGVFFGLHCNEFENALADDPNFKSSGYFAQFAVKVAQYFDLRGLTVTFDAACASGFVGLHNAVQALKDGTVDQAIVCSSNIPIHPTGSFIFLQMQMLSPTGYSRFLDSRADGYVKSEACVSVLLQKKHLAKRNYASVMATMTSVDGYKSEGITFPSYKSQERLIRACKQEAGLLSDHVEYLEAHGTGTPAGDPQEARAIASVYLADDSDDADRRHIGPLMVGSVKTNMGHSEAASGLCSLTKVTLMLEHELIYQGLHYDRPNTNIESLKQGKLKFVAERQPLRAKIVPLSCYGFGGSNVHVIVRANERPSLGDYLESFDEDQAPRLVVLFGRNEESISAFFDRMLDENDRQTRHCLSDDFLALVDSISRGEIDRLMEYRGFMLVDRRERKQVHRSIRKLRNLQKTPTNLLDKGRRVHLQDSRQRHCHLVLPGLGCQWTGMAAGFKDYRPFWQTIERLDDILAPFKDQVDLVENLTVKVGPSMCETFVSIVAYQIALINIIKNQLKVNNLKSIVGHSLGEISCAYAAGLFNERETIMVAYHLGSALDQVSHLIRGKMAVLWMNEKEALNLIKNSETIRVSCVNGPNSVTISGRELEMEKMLLELKEKDIPFKELECSNIALHNDLIMNAEIKATLKEHLLKVLFSLATYDRSKTEWISSSSIESNEANAEYFAESMCTKVDFHGALLRLSQDSILLELGPHGLFESQILDMKFNYAKLMKMNTENQKLELLKSIGNLYQLGVTFQDLTQFHVEQQGRSDKLQLPVRRQTPSLSSLWRWNHQNQHFVPRYPIQFSKSSAKCEMPVDIVQDRDKFIADHCIEGRILYPATGYLFLIWRVFSFTKRQIYDACFQDVEHELVPIEFHNVRLMRATILSNNRGTQIYIHYEEGTGRFEIKEGGSVVVEGYARSPSDSPSGLLYEHIGDQIKHENLELTLTGDDVYKQFRLSGYDYGPNFQNIQLASSDGRRSLVKFNGHFIALTDSILQSIFLAISQYAPSGGLFLPTRFDYVRFQPEIILKKIREARWCFDLSDGSLNTQAKREIMTKIMERERGLEAIQEEQPKEMKEEEVAQPEVVKEDERLECIFETYCDPITGIIVTDGIEMRGIKATPAPRRMDNNEVLMESYQFIRDIENPIEDEHLTQFDAVQNTYARVCDSMSLELLAKLCGQSTLNCDELLDEISGGQKMATKEEIELYKQAKLNEVYTKEKEHYDIQKNGDHMLLSILDQLQAENQEPRKVKEVVEANRLHLMHDLLQAPFTSERLMRPAMETIIENSCVKKQKLRLLEINLDDGLLKLPLQHLIQSAAPTVALDYSLAHPEPSRLSGHKALSSGPMGASQTTKTFALTKGLAQLFQDEQQQLKELDVVVYKDISCYSLPKQVIEQNHILPVLSSLNQAVRPGGFVMMVMRQRLSLAERILLSLAEPQLVGLSLKDLERMSANEKSLEVAEVKIRHINAILASRMQSMLREAERNRMLCLAQKSDHNGCTVLLFKRTSSIQVDQTPEVSKAKEEVEEKKLVLRVTHEDQFELDEWLEELKRQFKKDEEDEKRAVDTRAQVVWLCAVASREKPVNGLIGMMQALGKEVGWSRLRCFYDCCTFKNQLEPISAKDIEASERFQLALRRDLLWNCVDEEGYWGAYKHLTINNYLSYDSCLCSHNPPMVSAGDKEAYVNNATKGDLSSFTWFEAPFKYLNDEEMSSKVQVAYAALNFRDIMLATGRLPLDAIPIRLAMSDCLLGLEFAGLDVDGKRVMGMVFGRGIATHVLCPQQSSIKLEVPEWMSLRDAATMPVVYATAIMALIYRGRMQRGETLLVHAGSGGVGQAAIRLAQYFGVEVYATVGSQEKRQFLKDEFNLNDGHIFNSRDTTFEFEVMAATRGRGVDLVLNSLADDKLQASLRCLADGGRFLEIGKYDMSTDARLELLHLDTNKSFHGILLDKLFDTDECGPAFVEQLKCVLATMRDGLAKGYVRPIKHTLFQSHQIEEAFRFMATGKHMGKVLVEINASLDLKNNHHQKAASTLLRARSCVPRFQLSSTKTYVITGGLGGFGLELVKWLVVQGARHLVLAGRSGLRNGYQRATLARLESNNGAKFRVVTGDEADLTKADGARHLCDLAQDLSPTNEIGGLFHLAMVLKDSLLDNLTAADFHLVCKPKIEVARQLDLILTRPNHKLDYFVAFSSVASGKGNAGQANYAYANSYLERLCERRKSRGEHGLAIQWGAIGDVGVAYENLGGNNIIIGGTLPQRMPSCLQTLAKLIGSPFATCLSVVPVNRNGADGGMGERGDLVGAIMHVLGIKDPSKVSEQATLGELGLDSLMAVEIRQYIEREYDMTLNIQEIRSLTIAKIREISENGKPTGAKQEGAKSVEGPREVNSYGSLSGQNGDKPDHERPGLGGNDMVIEKEMIQGFVPDLRLPKDDFCFLNYVADDGNGAPSGRPLFFLPPIHGQFDKLRAISKTIARPCIGLNWTRRLGKAETMPEVVDTYLDLLKRADWTREFNLQQVQQEARVVDLVGYSYGATVAFEMMLALHRPLQNGNKSKALNPGKLILLDGSPKQIELGSQYLGSLTQRKPMKLSEKVNEMLMLYILAHTSKLNLPRQRYLEFQVKLAQAELDSKGQIASRFLMDALNLNDEDGLGTDIAHSMEAFCRKYHLISQYKATKSLPDDCSLIRAEKLYMKREDEEKSFNEDLELSQVVQGKVSLYVMPGDHDSFLLGANSLEVSKIISRTANNV